MAKNEALSKLQSMMNHNQTPRMDTVRGGNDFLNAFSQGYNIMGTVMDGIRARNDRKRLQEQLKQVLGVNQQQPQSDLPIITDEKGNSFSILGDGNAVPVNTQQQDPDYSMKGFMKNAIGSGMLPSNAMAAYGSFIAPLEADARDRAIRDAMGKLAYVNNGLSKEDQLKALAQINYNMGKEYNIEHLKNLTDLYSKQYSGILAPLGLGHNPKTLENVDIYIPENAWDQLAPTVGINPTNYGNYSMGFNNGSAGSEYGGDNENARIIYGLLKREGLTDNAIAAIMGNIEQESTFNPSAYNKGSDAYGLGQWRLGRKDNLMNYAKSKGKDWQDIGTQIEFMLNEIKQNHPDLLQRMSNLNPYDAALLFEKEYEVSGDEPDILAQRGKNADAIYNGRRAGGRDWSQSLEGKSWVRNNNNVDLSKAQNQTLQGLNQISDAFQRMTGKQLIVTSGNDSNVHAGGQFSHENGWKVDVSGNGLENPETRNAFIKQCESLGIKVRDEYSDPSPGSTGEHLDLDFSGYRGGNSVGYSSQPQKPSYFGSVFKPQVVRGRGAILNPMVLLEALTKQAERQRLQNNADRQFYVNQQQLIEDMRHNLAMESIRSGNGKTKANPLEIDLPADLQRDIMVSLERFKNGSATAKDTDGKISTKLGDNVAGAYAPLYRYLINNGMSHSDVRNFMFKHITSELGKDYNKIVSNESIWDIIDQASELYKRNTPIEQFSEFSKKRRHNTENKELKAKDLINMGLGYVPKFDKDKMDKYMTKEQMIDYAIKHYYDDELGKTEEDDELIRNKWGVLGN